MSTNKDYKLTSKILTKLAGMNNVQIVRDETGGVSLVKEELKFGEILNTKLKLLNKEGKYHLINNSIISDNDLLLKAATNAYWIASGKK
jgi:hypothetical protein